MYFDAAAFSVGASLLALVVEGARVTLPLAMAGAAAWLFARGVSRLHAVVGQAQPLT